MRDIEFEIAQALIENEIAYHTILALSSIKEMTDEALENIYDML